MKPKKSHTNTHGTSTTTAAATVVAAKKSFIDSYFINFKCLNGKQRLKSFSSNINNRCKNWVYNGAATTPMAATITATATAISNE